MHPFDGTVHIFTHPLFDFFPFLALPPTTGGAGAFKALSLPKLAMGGTKPGVAERKWGQL